MRNFNGVFEMISSLNAAGISRLKRTWREVRALGVSRPWKWLCARVWVWVSVSVWVWVSVWCYWSLRFFLWGMGG